MKKTTQGFTLIELLVVVGLLGILALIVLAALTTAKSRGEDAGIQASMKNLQTQAGLYHAQNGNVGALSSNCTTASSMFVDATTYGLLRILTPLRADTTVECYSTPTNLWVISAQLKNDPSKFWCVDSSGVSRQRTAAATSTATLCNGN